MPQPLRNILLRLWLLAVASLSCTAASAQSVLIDQGTTTYGTPSHDAGITNRIKAPQLIEKSGNSSPTWK